jgi:hypothetical protein
MKCVVVFTWKKMVYPNFDRGDNFKKMSAPIYLGPKNVNTNHQVRSYCVCEVYIFSMLFIFGQGFHYVLFLEYISVDADDQDSGSSVDSN